MVNLHTTSLDSWASLRLLNFIIPACSWQPVILAYYPILGNFGLVQIFVYFI